MWTIGVDHNSIVIIIGNVHMDHHCVMIHVDHQTPVALIRKFQHQEPRQDNISTLHCTHLYSGRVGTGPKCVTHLEFRQMSDTVLIQVLEIRSSLRVNCAD